MQNAKCRMQNAEFNVGAIRESPEIEKLSVLESFFHF